MKKLFLLLLVLWFQPHIMSMGVFDYLRNCCRSNEDDYICIDSKTVTIGSKNPKSIPHEEAIFMFAKEQNSGMINCLLKTSKELLQVTNNENETPAQYAAKNGYLKSFKTFYKYLDDNEKEELSGWIQIHVKRKNIIHFLAAKAEDGQEQT